MKNTYKYLLIIFMAAVWHGCEVLEKKPLGYISDADMWNDPALIDGYLRQCYSDMKFFDEGSDKQDLGSYMPDNVIYLATNMSDEACNWGHYNWRHFSFYFDAWPWWNYPLVRKLNIFLEKLETSPIADKDKLSREGECRFLRAYAYFNMVKRYGGVPLILKVQKETDPKDELFPKRATEDAIYQFIIDEVDWITSNNALPKSVAESDRGRPSRYAALALKSRAALYAGTIAKFTSEKGLTDLVYLSGAVGIDPSRAQYFLTESYNASNEIINESGLDLYRNAMNRTSEDFKTTYQNIFLEKNNCEVIFAEHFTGTPGRAHSWDMWQVPYGYDGWQQGQFSRVFPQLVDAFENMDGTTKTLASYEDGAEHTLDEMFGNKDPRYAASIYTEGTKFKDSDKDNTLRYYREIIKPDGSIQNEGSHNAFPAVGLCTSMALPVGGIENPFGVLKYLDENDKYARSAPMRSKTDWIVFRMGEIYLNRAEAAFELGIGNPEGDINEIRHRVGMPDAPAITREVIRHERQVELVFEGARAFDIHRWREGPKYLGKNPYSIVYQLVYESTTGDGPWRYKIKTGKVYPDSGNDFKNKNYYHPITPARYDVNPNLEENPGWKEEGQ